MINFLKIVTDLQDFCESHAQVTKTYYEDEHAMEGSTESTYPCVLIEREPSVMNSGQNNFSLLISVLDMAKPDQSNKAAIDSKCYEILSDIRKHFNDTQGADYLVESPVTNEPLANEKNDRLRGFAASMTFVVNENAGCDYPGE